MKQSYAFENRRTWLFRRLWQPKQNQTKLYKFYTEIEDLWCLLEGLFTFVFYRKSKVKICRFHGRSQVFISKLFKIFSDVRQIHKFSNESASFLSQFIQRMRPWLSMLQTIFILRPLLNLKVSIEYCVIARVLASLPSSRLLDGRVWIWTAFQKRWLLDGWLSYWHLLDS